MYNEDETIVSEQDKELKIPRFLIFNLLVFPWIGPIFMLFYRPMRYGSEPFLNLFVMPFFWVCLGLYFASKKIPVKKKKYKDETIKKLVLKIYNLRVLSLFFLWLYDILIAFIIIASPVHESILIRFFSYNETIVPISVLVFFVIIAYFLYFVCGWFYLKNLTNLDSIKNESKEVLWEQKSKFFSKEKEIGVGFKGWLFVFMLSFFLYVFILSKKIIGIILYYSNPEVFNSLLINKESIAYHSVWPWVILLKIVFLSFLLFFSVKLCLLFIKKQKNFSVMFLKFFVLTAFFIIADFMLIYFSIGQAFPILWRLVLLPQSIKLITLVGIYFSVCLPYIFVSTRAKNTFVA